MHYFKKGSEVVLFILISYFLFHFALFARNPLAFLGFVFVIPLCYFFLEYAFYFFVLTLPLLSDVPRLLNLAYFSPSELIFLCLLNAYLLKIIFDKEKVVFFKNSIDLAIIIFSLVLISSFLSSSITHYPFDYFYKEKVFSVLKRLLFIHNPYDYSYIFKSVFKMLEGIFCFFIATNVLAKKKILNRIYAFLLLGWGSVIILGFIQYFGGTLGHGRFAMRMFSMFNHPNLFAGYLICIFPFSIFYSMDKPFLKKMLLWILTVVSVMALILTRSKNSWIAFTLLLIFMGIYSSISFIKEGSIRSFLKIVKWKWAIVFSICLVVIFGSFYMYLSKRNVIGLLREDLNWGIPIDRKLEGRAAIWKVSLKILEDFPLWGVGIGEFNFILPKYSYGYPWNKECDYHPHNYFLQIAVEMGLVGLFAFLWILWKVVVKGFQIMKEGGDLKRLGLWFGIMGFVFTFFGDGYLWNIEMMLMFWLFIGLLFADEKGEEVAQVHRKPFDKKLLIGLSIIILLTIPFQIYQRSQLSFLPERSIGLYKEVFKEEGKEYRWGEKVVLMPLEKSGRWVQIPVKLGNPDIKEKPVKVKVFMNKRLIDHLEFNDNNWHVLKYSVENIEGAEVRLKLEASRTWNPYLTDGTLYPWDLGPAVGKIYWSS